MSFIKGKFKFSNIAIFDKHHRMERLCAMFVSFFIVFAIILSYGFYCQGESSKITLTTRALYTEGDLKWSLSEKKIKVVDVYRNNNSTKALIMMHMYDMKNVSTDANNYEVYITDSQGGDISHADSIKGAVYVFGNTGYIGISLTDTKGFEPLIYDIFVWNTAAFSAEEKPDFDANQDSAKNHNQIEIKVNLAGTDATVANCLNRENASINDIYAECAVVEDVSKIKDGLKEDLLELNTQFTLMYEYKRRLEGYGFEVNVPVCIANDRIVADVKETVSNPVRFDEDMTKTANAIISDYTDVFADSSEGTAQTFIKSDNVYLKTDFVFPGGVQYNYQDIDITEHYSEKISPRGMTYAEWKQFATDENKNYKTSSWFDKDTKNWIRNGTPYNFENTDASGSTSNSVYNADITMYNEIVQRIVDLKHTYQTKSLYKLLDLDDAAQSISSIVSINNSSKAVTIF